MSVKRAQLEIDSKEFAEWLAMEEIDGPQGPERDDVRSGALASILANVMIGLWSKRGHGRRLSVADCTLKFKEKRPRRASQAEIRQKLDMWRQGVQAMFNRKLKRGKKP